MAGSLVDASFSAIPVAGTYAAYAGSIGLASEAGDTLSGPVSGTPNTPIIRLANTPGWLERQDFFYDFYFRIWITPIGLLDLGGVSSEQIIPISVWSAYPDSAKTLTSIGIDGLDDGQLNQPGLTPLLFDALEMKNFTLTVGTSGSPSINVLITWNFNSDISQSLNVVGFRARIWPLQADWREPPLDRYEWLTDVMESRSGFEQRVQLREIPRRTIQSTFVVSGDDLGWFDALLVGWGSRGFLIPVWYDKSRLDQKFTAGSQRFYCDTSKREFAPGSYILVGSDLKSAVAAEVQQVFADGVLVKRVVATSFAKGQAIWPARAVRVTSPAQQTQHTAGVIATRITFEVTDQPDITPVPSTTLYKGLQVLTREHNWASTISRSYDRKLTILDNDTGSPLWIDLSNWAQITRQYNFMLMSSADRQDFIGWLSSLRGRVTPFWRENRETLIEMSTRQPAATTALLHITPIGFPALLFGMANRMALVLRHINGTVYYRTILAADTDVASGDELLTLDVNLPASVPSDWKLITYLELVRLDADAIEIAHASDDVAQVQMALRGIKQ